MKKGLKILLVYFEFFVVAMLIGTLFYSFYLSVSNFVFGRELQFFSVKYFSKAFFYVLYCVLFLICPLIAYYRIRHIGGFFQGLFYVLMCILTWGVFLPLSFKFEDYHLSKSKPEVVQPKQNLTSEYFRELDNKVYYFMGDDEDSVIVIDKGEKGSVDIVNNRPYYEKRLLRDAKPYKEIQIKDIFESKGIPTHVYLKDLTNAAKEAYSKGFIFALAFLSMGLALCSLYSFSGFLKWRALNTCLLALLTNFILSINTIFYAGEGVAFTEKTMQFGFMKWLSNYMDQPVAVIFNLIMSFIFILFGIICSIVRKAKKKA